MSEVIIECPNCHQPFELTEALAGPLLEAERANAHHEALKAANAERTAIEAQARRDMAAEHATELRCRDAAIAERDARLRGAQEAELQARKARVEAEEAKRRIELDVHRRVDAERDMIARLAAEKAVADTSARLAEAHAALQEKDEKLAEAQKFEIEARRLRAEAEEQKREVELTVTRRLDDERAKVRAQAERERDEEHRLKLSEKDEQLRVMQEKIEELRRRGSQVSQQLAGEVQELDLVEILSEAFPGDRFERVRKGQRGADVLQTVRPLNGLDCGRIIWEFKRTKTWAESWLSKLRDDQREAKADVAALVTETLPDDVSTFEHREGVWVTSISVVVPVAAALRHGLIEVAIARRAGALSEATKDQVFAYLTGQPFRQRITSVTESYVEMRADLDKEKRATLTLFGKREKQLERLVGGLAGFYGDLQGIVGSNLPPVPGLLLTMDDRRAPSESTLVDSGQEKLLS